MNTATPVNANSTNHSNPPSTALTTITTESYLPILNYILIYSEPARFARIHPYKKGQNKDAKQIEPSCVQVDSIQQW